MTEKEMIEHLSDSVLGLSMAVRELDTRLQYYERNAVYNYVPGHIAGAEGLASTVKHQLNCNLNEGVN